MAIYITGDTHGDFERIEEFCTRMGTSKDDVMIILGDAGINFYGETRDAKKKEYLSQLPIKFFCVHGNHEMRPASIEGYTLSKWNGGQVWLQYEYPNIMFAKDGEIYNIAGKQCIVIGGAYSVDKWWRLQNGWPWFKDEQPDEETKNYVESRLAARDWKIDVVLSHTVPFNYMPVDLFIKGIDQSTVDNSTEDWLDTIEKTLDYRWWYAGHYHCERVNRKVQIMFDDIEEFGRFNKKSSF